MKNRTMLEFHAGSREELLPGFEAEFPYIASNAELDQYAGRSAPWHWHKAIELFYMESGTLEYYTPKKKLSFSAGSGGFINSNVLHMTKAISRTEKNIQRLHIFDAALISGNCGSRIEKRYVIPVTANPQIELYALHPDHPRQARILHLIKDAFDFCENDIGYALQGALQLCKGSGGIRLELPSPASMSCTGRRCMRFRTALFLCAVILWLLPAFHMPI